MKREFPDVWEIVLKDLKIIHFTGVKPWQWHKPPELPLERQMWWDTWGELEAERAENGLPNLGSMGRKPNPAKQA